MPGVAPLGTGEDLLQAIEVLEAGQQGLLGQARGAALSALTAGGLPVAEYTALQVKQAVVGHGKANKEQVQFMVTRLLALAATPGTDAADALACAICHAHAARGIGALAGPGSRRRGGRIIARRPA